MIVKKLVLTVCFYLIICNTAHAKRASIEITKTIKTIHSSNIYEIDSVLILTPESDVPKGYYTIALGKTSKGLLTIKCSEQKMIILAKQKALEINAHAIQLYSIRPGSMINTCYRFSIRFLVRKIDGYDKH
jgi:hypothetical protein